MKPEDRKEQLQGALEAAKEALAVLDSSSEDLVTLRAESVPLTGEVRFDRREYNRSIVSLRKMFRREKKDVAFKEAKILALQGDKTEAILTLKRATEDTPIDSDEAMKKLEADIRCYLGILYEDLGQPRLALKEFRKVLKDCVPDHAESLRGVERLRRYSGQDRPGN